MRSGRRATSHRSWWRYTYQSIGAAHMYQIPPKRRGVARTRLSVLDPQTMINAHRYCRCLSHVSGGADGQ